MEKAKHIVILAAGDFPTHPVPLRALHEADMVVCCDSAYGEWKKAGGARKEAQPFVVIGDGDSLPAALKQELGDRWKQVDEQDYNDLHKAMAWACATFGERCAEAHSTPEGHCPQPLVSRLKITILGATGRREDHTIGNISYLATFAEEYPHVDIEMLTDHGRFFAFTGHRTFRTFARQQVSVFTLTPQLPFSGTGLQWPLDRFHATRWWQATLNSALGDSVSLWSEGWLVVFLTYDAKD